MGISVLLRRVPAPILSAILLVLLAIAIAFWDQRSDRGAEANIAQISRTRAELYDGDCEFSADVHLASRWSRFAFSMQQQTVRTALIALLRTKSVYMVDSSPAREAVRHQMLTAVNAVIGAGRATDLRFKTFELL
jgi:hypothetical protein